jgi:hypothetical protein
MTPGAIYWLDAPVIGAFGRGHFCESSDRYPLICRRLDSFQRLPDVDSFESGARAMAAVALLESRRSQSSDSGFRD